MPMVHVIFKAASGNRVGKKHIMCGPATDCWCEPEIVDLGLDEHRDQLKLIMHDPTLSVST